MSSVGVTADGTKALMFGTLSADHAQLQGNQLFGVECVPRVEWVAWRSRHLLFRRARRRAAALGSVGMVTDSRSCLSYSRREYFRRLLCNLLGDDVRRGLLPDDRNTARCAGPECLLLQRARVLCSARHDAIGWQPLDAARERPPILTSGARHRTPRRPGDYCCPDKHHPAP